MIRAGPVLLYSLSGVESSFSGDESREVDSFR